MTNETHTHQEEEAAAPIGFGRAPTTASIDAAIERHQDARGDLQRATEAVDVAGQADGAAWADLLATRPSDVLGAVRLLRYVSASPASEAVEDVQDLLRQLTASVEAAEAGERSGPSANLQKVGDNPDPVFAAAAEYRSTWAAAEAATREGCGDVPDEESEAMVQAYDRLRAVRPTTAAGFRLLAETWAWRLEQDGGGDDSLGDHIANSLIAGAGACVPAGEVTAGSASASAQDPAFPAIEAHRAAYAEWDRLSDVWNRMSSDDPGYAEAMAASDLPGRREVETYEALLTTRPATLAGAKALAEYLVVAVRRVSVNAEPSDGDRALQTVSETLFRLLGPGATDGAGRNWQAYAANHPGFVPYPAHAPVSLMALDLAIRGEAERFLKLAEEEIERRRQDYAGSPDPAVWPRVERDLRREMRMDALAMVAAKPSDDGPPDPAFAAIDASRRAEAEMAAFGEEATGPLTAEMRAREDALCEAQRRTLAAAWATVPTTHAGRLALVDFARFQVEVHTGPDGRVGSPDELLEEVLNALSAAIQAERLETAATSPGAPSEQGPSNLDALALVAAIEAEWASQARTDDDAQPVVDAEADYARRSALLSAADRLPADTCAARHAKALALAWIMYADLWRPERSRDSYTTDGRLAFDINAAFQGAPTAKHPDADLLARGPTIAALIAAQDTVPSEEEDAYEKIDGLVMAETRRVADMRARTLDGLAFKARWVERGADEELKDGIVADLLAMRDGK